MSANWIETSTGVFVAFGAATAADVQHGNDLRHERIAGGAWPPGTVDAKRDTSASLTDLAGIFVPATLTVASPGIGKPTMTAL